MSGRHGGGYVQGQGQAPVSPVDAVPDLTELQAMPPAHQRYDTGSSYGITEMPAPQYGQYQNGQQSTQQPEKHQYHQPQQYDQQQYQYQDQKQPEVTYNPQPIMSAYNTVPQVNQAWNHNQHEVAITIDHQPPNYSHFLDTAVSTRVRKPQRGGRNCMNSGNSFRFWKHPHLFQHPNPKPAPGERYRHRDSMARVYRRPAAERFLDPYDGRLTKLMVQTADEIYRANDQAHPWRRTYIRKVGPIFLRAAYWPYKRAPSDAEDRLDEDKMAIAIRWLPACLALFILLPFPGPSAEQLDGLQYHAFPYKYWGTCKVARNPKEDTKPSRALHWNSSVDDQKGERLLRPRYLMFLNSPGKGGAPGHTCMTDEAWNNSQSSEVTKRLPYAVIAYTKDQFSDDPSDLDALLDIAEVATRNAGLSAFWIGCSCMPEPQNIEEDVYRINDVIRGAYSLIIALGNPKGAKSPHDTGALLMQWGSRMWTFPEALLSPNDKPVEIYTRGGDMSSPIVLAKKDLPTWAWSDADMSRQLMDHFQGSLTLSRLEIVKIAMKCLHARKTDAYLPGDMAYALMGLLRRRPMVDRTDSEFQALARLSLANDSDCLLERLICVLPKDLSKDWLRADDSWDINLWDIYPKCQVAGVGDNDTVILDGCRAASIKWDKFEPVAVARRDSWRRLFARVITRLSPILTIIGIATIQTAPGVIVMIIGLALWLASPYLVKVMYGGKFWDQQAWIFGIEGYVDIATLEACIFGYNMNRLSWSVSGSPLSRHSVNKFGEWIGRDPCDDPHVGMQVERAKNASVGQSRIFTLIDTFTMTVTMIEAVRPPVMVLLCASEGGMQRAVLCSYEWKSQTLFKETVMRMETQVLERMPRIGRVNFGFFRSSETHDTGI